MKNTPITSRSRSPDVQGTILSLPLELLCEIFLFSTALKFEHITNDSPTPPRFSTTALAISHVCTNWRSITLSFPEHWASISVCCPTKQIVELVKLYLERSGEASLLDLSMIDVLYGVGPTDEWSEASNTWQDCARQIFKLWIPHARRLVGLHLRLRYMVARELLYDIPADALQNLQRASVEEIDDWDAGVLWRRIHVSQRLHLIHWPSLTKRPSLGTFQHITELYLPRLSLVELATLPSLSRLTKLGALGVLYSPEVKMVELPALESLRIDILSKDSAWLLDRLHTPSLRHLQFDQRVELVDPFALHRFLMRNGCSLQQLYLAFCHSSEENVLKYIVSAAPPLFYLKNLYLQSSLLTESTVNTFAPAANYGQVKLFLPSLEQLSLMHSCLEDGLIAKMVVARAYAGHPLTTLQVRYRDKGCHYLIDKAILHKSKQYGPLKQIQYSIDHL